ncbi:MAG: pyrroline-5-carboxylate reductase family protein [Christensenellales bacterium]
MKLGFIGAGNMGSAIISGILNKGALPADCITSAANTRKRRGIGAKGVHIMKDNLSLVRCRLRSAGRQARLRCGCHSRGLRC